MWRKFKRHKAGLVGLVSFIIILLFIIFPEFTAPYSENETTSYIYAPPQFPRFIDENGKVHFRPFIYKYKPIFDITTGKTQWLVDTSEKYYLSLFVKGSPYNFLFIKSDIHLFGVDKGGYIFLLGTDGIGRDLFTRLLYGGRTSLLVAFLTALVSLGLGTIVGLLSGYFGGLLDIILQRILELFLIIPDIPLGLALAAFLPPDLAPEILMFGVAIVISITRWANVARQIRGKVLAIRTADFVMAAIATGASTFRILFKHVLPQLYPHLIVLATLTIPQAILAESALSFLGFGIRPPKTSWGLLLKEAQNLRVIALYPWLLIPGIAISITVLALNFIGDGLRDAIEPHS
jgi:peptide/nickel transport system permease protein